MSGRRSHVRFAVIRSPEGIFRVMRDVLVQRTRDGDVIAVGREPGVVGETVALELPADDAVSLQARVVESQPVVVNGSVRHRLRLRETDGTSDDDGVRMTGGQGDR
jgi:hypothetical protein